MTWFFAVLGGSVRGCGRDGIWHQWSGVLHSGSQAPVCSLQQRSGSGLLAPAHAEETQRLQIGWEPQMHQRILLQWWDPDSDNAASRLFLCKIHSANGFNMLKFEPAGELTWNERWPSFTSFALPRMWKRLQTSQFFKSVQVTISCSRECGMMRLVLVFSYGGRWSIAAVLVWQQGLIETNNTRIHTSEWAIKRFWKWEEAWICREISCRLKLRLKGSPSLNQTCNRLAARWQFWLLQ